MISDDNAANTKRIAKNTLMLYIRMMFGMLVSLYTSRVVLAALGVEDYGIYNVVGGFVAMFSLISSSLSSSVGRFLTFELGKGNLNNLRRVFSTSVLIHIALAVVVLLLAETVGIWFLNAKMTIPESRMYAANWVFQASVISFMFSLLTVPYNASIIAHEKMTAFAYIGILDVLLRLVIVLFIAYAPFSFDRLIVYGSLLVVVNILLQCIYLAYCLRHFVECRSKLFFDKACWKEMSAFAGWNFIGCSAALLKDQGVNILLNLFVGPVLNAARGIATTVNGAVASFANNFMMALNPQITKNYASGDYSYMFSLVKRGSRFSFYILFMLALPILIETDFILTLWLGNFPEHTANFVRLVLILSLSDIVSNTLITLQNATGKIRTYQIVVGGVLLLNFPFSYLCLYLGFPPESTMLVAIGVSVCCLILRLCFLRRSVGLSIRGYLWNVGVNVLMVSAISVVIPYILHNRMSDGWERFLLVTVVSVMVSSMIIFYVGCTPGERAFLKQKVRELSKRFK